MEHLLAAVAEYVGAASDFENRLSLILGESKSPSLRPEALKRSYKIVAEHSWRSGLYASVNKASGDIQDFVHEPDSNSGRNIFRRHYRFPVLPIPGSKEADLWEAWWLAFNRIPFGLADDFVKLAAKADLEILLEAIQITASRGISDDHSRLRYIYGILRNRKLAEVSPERAAIAKEFYSLRVYRQSQPRGRGYLNRPVVERWLVSCTPDEIRAVMHATSGYWADLREEMDRIVASREQQISASATPAVVVIA